jgi:hypothetical protein
MSSWKRTNCGVGIVLAASTLLSAAQIAPGNPAPPNVSPSRVRGIGTPGDTPRLQERSINTGIDIHALLTDPAIRNFVGLAEYAWDFNAPDAVHGFGPLRPTDDIGRLLAQAVRNEPPLNPSQNEDTIRCNLGR